LKSISYTFSKDERLNSKVSIEELFKKGNSFFKYPFKVIYGKALSEEKFIIKLLISVPKRTFKKAVDRNSIKRLIREAYRLNKHILYDSEKIGPSSMNIALIYNAKSILSYQEIERKIILILQTIKKQDEVPLD
jgi:ribonuclease P protein component